MVDWQGGTGWATQASLEDGLSQLDMEGAMSKWGLLCVMALTTVAATAALALATAKPSGAFIHEMIGASCRFGGEDVEPPGQVPGGPSKGNSTTRALIAAGVISSIVDTPTRRTINFDLSRPNAKFVSAGFTLVIPNGAGPGVELALNPAPTIDGSTFPAFIHCANLNP